jgi:hypothetical protein
MMDRDERALFSKGVADATTRSTGHDLDAALAELGWADALALDEQVAVAALFEAQGRAATTSGSLDVVLSAALGVAPGPVVLPPLGRVAPPGRIEGGTLTVDGLVTASAGLAHVVTARAGDVALAQIDLADLEQRAIRGLDPGAGLIEVRGTAPPHELWPGPKPVGWEYAVAAGQRAIAHELVGAAAAVLDLARGHAVERVQFGVPIASFQAVRHKLADSLVAVEAARAALDAAWEGGSPFHATVAKAIAGRSARLVVTHGQQVLAGIGFTTEHPLHRYVRRVRVLDALLGDARTLTRALGERLLRDRGLPAILPL